MSTGTLVAIIAPTIGIVGAGPAGVLAVYLTWLRADIGALRGDVRSLETRIEQRIAESDARNATRICCPWISGVFCDPLVVVASRWRARRRSTAALAGVPCPPLRESVGALARMAAGVGRGELPLR